MFEIEEKAANDIQRCFRGSIARKHIKFLSENATKIEHIFRGYLSHRKLDRLKKQAHQQELNIFYNYMSVIIQKSYRGYYSRKYQHDFYARKKYINDVIDKGNLIKEKMVLYLEDQIKEAYNKEVENQEKQLEQSKKYTRLFTKRALAEVEKWNNL